VLKLLDPFVITTANYGLHDEPLSVLEKGVREIYANSDFYKNLKGLSTNTFLFVLDHEGRPVDQFAGGAGRSGDCYERLVTACRKLVLPRLPAKQVANLSALPDLSASPSGLPGGLRLFIRLGPTKLPASTKLPIVEVVPMKAEEWRPLALPTEVTEIAADHLKDTLVWLYPAGIRTADESNRFQAFTGTLKLEPAGADKEHRYALLRGAVKASKGSDRQSTFEGTLELVLTYRLDSPQVKSVRGVVSGDFIYRTGGIERMPLTAAIESRP
jgi:hypothetical protein